MSKYYKAEDVTELITACVWRMTLAKERGGNGFVEYDKRVLDVEELRKRLAKLPTIEVSEDAISRKDAIKAIESQHTSGSIAEIQRIFDADPHSSKTDFEETLLGIFYAIQDAPSVIPQTKEGE